MADYRDKLDEWREAARRKARELDEKYGVRERVEEGAKAAGEAARRGAEKVSSAAERARAEAERLGEDFDVDEHAQDVRERAESARQHAGRAAEEAARVAREAGEKLRAAGKSAGVRAEEVLGDAKKYSEGVLGGAKKYYDRASRAYDVTARATRLTTASSVGLFRAYDWARENPKRAIFVTLSLATGVRLGAAFPGIDGVLLGAHPHWFTHSALPVWAMRKVGQKFDSYLREREELMAGGELDEAERKRVEFERKMVRYVGAPLLGAFSCAAGVAMWAQILQPGPIVGAPISWLLGGNPILDGVLALRQRRDLLPSGLQVLHDRAQGSGGRRAHRQGD